MDQDTEVKICDRCLPAQSVTPTLVKYLNGKECKLCTFPFDSYSYKLKHNSFQTICCARCANKNSICQVCLNDFEYGIPMHLRNSMKQIMNQEADTIIPKNDMMKRFVGLSSKKVAPLDLDKLRKEADTIRKWKVRELPFHSNINTSKDILFLYNIDQKQTESQIASFLITASNNNLERENIVLKLNKSLKVGTLTFKHDAELWTQKLVSLLPKFKVGESLEKSYLDLPSGRVFITSYLIHNDENEPVDITKINVEQAYSSLVQKIILKDAASISGEIKDKTRKLKKGAKKTLRVRQKLDL